jgi:hypothetical protein
MWANPKQLWIDFFHAIDMQLGEPVQLHLIGGFVMTFVHDAPRYTADVDCVAVVPSRQTMHLLEVAGRGSILATKMNVHLEFVTVSDLPDEYESRLVPVLDGKFKMLRLMALDPYDILLSKLGRNSGKDRADVEYLAQHLSLRCGILTERFEEEMRSWIPNPERHALTIKLWCEDYFRS